MAAPDLVREYPHFETPWSIYLGRRRALTRALCANMWAGVQYEYLWADGVKVKKPMKLPAPQYVDALFDWIEEQVLSPRSHPLPAHIYGSSTRYEQAKLHACDTFVWLRDVEAGVLRFAAGTCMVDDT